MDDRPFDVMISGVCFLALVACGSTRAVEADADGGARGGGGGAGGVGLLGTGGAGGGLSDGSGGVGVCGQVAPCGGSVVGTWKTARSCVNVATLDGDLLQAFGRSCPEATTGLAPANPTNTLTFNSDLTYTLELQQVATLNVPAGCTNRQPCSLLTDALRQDSRFPLGGDCTGTTTCACSIAEVPWVGFETGTYAVTSGIAGPALQTTSTEGGGRLLPYCVQGSYLHLVSVDPTMRPPPMGQRDIFQDIILQKQ